MKWVGGYENLKRGENVFEGFLRKFRVLFV